MRVGVLGGAFDPVHFGHLLVALDVRRRLGLDRILLVPTFRPPHRRPTRTGFADRLKMTRLSVRGLQGFDVSPVERDLPTPSYTIGTLEYLKRELKSASPYLILGADQYASMGDWHRSKAIGRAARIVVVSRPGVPRPPRLRCHPAHRVRFVDAVPVDISASAIRERVAKRRSIRYMLPSAVADYISAKRLYR